mgnify:CR=1 FL=1
MFWTETCFERYAPRQDANAVTPVSVPPTGVISDLVMSATPPHMPIDAILPRSTYRNSLDASQRPSSGSRKSKGIADGRTGSGFAGTTPSAPAL